MQHPPPLRSIIIRRHLMVSRVAVC